MLHYNELIMSVYDALRGASIRVQNFAQARCTGDIGRYTGDMRELLGCVAPPSACRTSPRLGPGLGQRLGFGIGGYGYPNPNPIRAQAQPGRPAPPWEAQRPSFTVYRRVHYGMLWGMAILAVGICPPPTHSIFPP